MVGNAKLSISEGSPPPKTSLKKKIIFAVFVVVGIVVAFIVGYLVRRGVHKCEDNNGKVEENSSLEEFYKQTASLVSRDELKSNLRLFAKEPHIASLPRNNLLGDEIETRFKSYGFLTQTPSYNVLLSFPDDTRPNHVSVLADDGSVTYKSKSDSDGFVAPFSSYSPNGAVEAECFYANYGRMEDFKKLEELGVNCTGKISIIRYGKIFRGNKVKFAQECGAIGVVLYSDPSDYGPVFDDQLYPNSEYLPRDAVQRGNIKTSAGDPTTEGYPGKDYVYRKRVEDTNLLKLPTQPISADDALNIMREMDGVEVPGEWKGMLGLKEVKGGNATQMTYRLTGKKKVKVEVYNHFAVKEIRDVIGTIKGAIEPDRYVMIGNHRDSWVNGAVDASSGTAVMMEVARVFAQKLKSGWKPRRTIKFISWDGEESGLHGSNEFAEEYRHELRQRAVVYVNIDIAVGGNKTLGVKGSPICKNVAFEASKMVKYLGQEATLYEKMVQYVPDKRNKDEPRFKFLGSGSDFAPMYLIGGVAAIDVSFFGSAFYYTYHTQHDTIEYMEKFLDPGYVAHESVAKYLIQLCLRLSNPLSLPLDVSNIAVKFEEGFNTLANKIGQLNLTVDTASLKNVIKDFKDATSEFEEIQNKISSLDTIRARAVNDIGTAIERTFLKDEGLPTNPSSKNYIFAPSSVNSYSASIFPTLSDAVMLHETGHLPVEAIVKELSAITVIIDASASFIKDGVMMLKQD